MLEFLAEEIIGLSILLVIFFVYTYLKSKGDNQATKEKSISKRYAFWRVSHRCWTYYYG